MSSSYTTNIWKNKLKIAIIPVNSLNNNYSIYPVDSYLNSSSGGALGQSKNIKKNAAL